MGYLVACLLTENSLINLSKVPRSAMSGSSGCVRESILCGALVSFPEFKSFAPGNPHIGVQNCFLKTPGVDNPWTFFFFFTLERRIE